MNESHTGHTAAIMITIKRNNIVGITLQLMNNKNADSQSEST